MISAWKTHTNREWLPVVASKWEKRPKNKSSIWPNWLALRKEDTDKKYVLIVMATNTAAQFLKSISHHSEKYLNLLFSSILWVSINQHWSRFFGAFATAYQSPSFLLFVLFSHIFRTCPNPFFSLFSLPSAATPWTTGAKVRHVLVCLSKWWIAVSHFIDGKHRLMAIFKAFTCVKIHRETPAKTLMSFSFNPRH